MECSSATRTAQAQRSDRSRSCPRSTRLGFLTAAIFLVVPGPLLLSTLDAQVTPADARQLYERHCTKCHRTDGTPKKIAKGAPAFGDPSWTATREQIEKSITNGKGEDMPRFKSKLTPEQIRALADRVLTFRAAAAQR